MNLNSSMRVSAGGLTVERFRMDVISSNIANANTMKIGNQDPYRRRMVAVVGNESSVEVAGIIEDQRPLRVVNEPGHPYADEEGNVYYSNIEPIEEMVNMISASRSYEANIAAFNAAKGMIKSALNIGKI